MDVVKAIQSKMTAVKNETENLIDNLIDKLNYAENDWVFEDAYDRLNNEQGNVMTKITNITNMLDDNAESVTKADDTKLRNQLKNLKVEMRRKLVDAKHEVNKLKKNDFEEQLYASSIFVNMENGRQMFTEVYNKAYEDGHAEGYETVEQTYNELEDLVSSVISYMK